MKYSDKDAWSIVQEVLRLHAPFHNWTSLYDRLVPYFVFKPTAEEQQQEDLDNFAVFFNSRFLRYFVTV